jgi:hypothetical protein
MLWRVMPVIMYLRVRSGVNSKAIALGSAATGEKEINQKGF